MIINGKHGIKLKSGSINFKIYFKKLPVSFKIYAYFECLLKGVKSSDKNNGLYTEKYQDHIPCSFAYKVVCIDKTFSKRVVLYGQESYTFTKVILKDNDYCKKLIKMHFHKNFITSAEEEERFQLNNSRWLCLKLFDVGDDKVRSDH